MENTIGTYKTKGYKHSGVTGGDTPKRMNESVNAITPQVMKENNMTAKVVKGGVKSKPIGEGMPLNSGRFKK